jgi:hypothetical protein
MDPPGGEVEATRLEKLMEERNNRVLVVEEQKENEEKEKAEKEKTAARGEFYAKAMKEFLESIEGMGEPKEPYEQFRDHWMELWGEGGHFGDFEDNSK